MQNSLKGNDFLPDQSLTIIQNLANQTGEIIKNTISLVVTFRQKNNTLKFQAYGNKSYNQNQYDLYKHTQYYYFLVGLKQIQQPLNNIIQSIKSYQISVFNTNIDSLIMSVHMLLDKLTLLYYPFKKKSLFMQDFSLGNTLNHLQDLKKNTTLIEENLAKIKNHSITSVVTNKLPQKQPNVEEQQDKKIRQLILQNESLRGEISNADELIEVLYEGRSVMFGSSEKINLSKLKQEIIRLRQQNQEMALQFTSMKQQVEKLAHNQKQEPREIIETRPKSSKTNNLSEAFHQNEQSNIGQKLVQSQREEDQSEFINLSESQSSEDKELKSLQIKINSQKAELEQLVNQIENKKLQQKQINSKITQLTELLVERQSDHQQTLSNLNLKKNQLESLKIHYDKQFKTFTSALITLMESIKLKELNQEISNKTQQVKELTKSNKPISHLIKITEQSINQTQNRMNSSLQTYMNNITAIKREIENGNGQISLTSDSNKINQCFDSFQIYLKNSFEFISSNLKFTIIKDKKQMTTYKELEVEIQNKTQALNNLKKEIDLKTKQINKLIDSSVNLENQQAQINSLNKNLVDLQSKLHQVQNNLIIQTADLQRLKTEIKASKTILDDMKKQQQKVKKEHTQAKSKLTQVQKENKQAELNLAQVQKQRQQAINKLAQVQKENKQALSRLAQEHQRAKQSLESKQKSSIESLESQYQRNIESLKHSHKKTIESLQAQQNKKIASIFTNIASQMGEQMDSINKKQQIEKLNQYLQSKQNQIIGLNNQIRCLDRQIVQDKQRHTRQISDLNATVVALQNELSNEKGLSSSLRDQIKTLNLQIHDVNRKLNTANLKTINLETQKTKLDHYKASLQKQFAQAALKLSQATAQQKKLYQKKINDKFNSIVNNFNQINQTLSKQRDHLSAQNQILNSNLQYMNLSLKKIYLSIYQYLNQFRNHTQILNIQLLNNIKNNQHHQLTAKDTEYILTSFFQSITSFEKDSQLQQNQIDRYQKKITTIEDNLETLKQILEKSIAGKSQLNRKLSFQGNPENIFEKIQLSLRKLDIKCHNDKNQLVSAYNKTYEQRIVQLKAQHKTALEKYKIKAKQEKEELAADIRVKQTENKKLQNSLRLLTLDKDKVQENLDESEHTNGQLLKTLQINQTKIQNQQKELIQLKECIERQNKNAGQNMQQFNQQKKRLQQSIDSLNQQLVDKSEQISELKKKVLSLEDKLALTNSRNNQSLSSQSNEIQILKMKIKDFQDNLRAKNQEIRMLTQQLRYSTEQLQKMKNLLDEQKRKISSGTSAVVQLKTQNDRLNLLIDQSKLQILQLKAELQNKILLQRKIDQLNAQIQTIQSQKEQLNTKKNFYKQSIKEIQITVRQKIGSQQPIDPKQIPQTISKMFTAIGCKLITSMIIHGYDTQRSDILKQIQQFTLREVKRTDYLGRYPDKNSLLSELPKNQAFIMLYKTHQGKIFGTFSEGLKKKTFVFAYFGETFDQYGQLQRASTPVKFYIPQKHSLNTASVELSDSRYLRYGNDELRINLMSMRKVSVNSEAIKSYYEGFQWKEITGANNEEEIGLAEVEMHSVSLK